MASVLTFGASNDAEISRLSPGFRLRVRAWMLLCRLVLGVTIIIVDGLRTPAEQAALHRQDPRNPLLPGDHGSGNAVDVNVWRNGKAVLLKASPAVAWAPIYRLAAVCGIKNGSTFPGYPDNNHFYRR